MDHFRRKWITRFCGFRGRERGGGHIGRAAARLGSTIEFDADPVELTEALRRFTRRSAGADVSLVLYAGRGIESDGVNHLAPCASAGLVSADQTDENWPGKRGRNRKRTAVTRDRRPELPEPTEIRPNQRAFGPTTEAVLATGCGASTRQTKSTREEPMGEIRSNVTLENTVDRGVVDRGHGQETDIRRTTVDGMMDTGAVSLVLPQNIVESLGLEQQGTAFVTYADERREERPLAGPVTVQIGNRVMVTDCVVGPPRSEPLIGQVVLDMLDLITDCANRTLAPRYPDYPVLKLKAVMTGEREDGRTNEREAIVVDLGHGDNPEVIEVVPCWGA